MEKLKIPWVELDEESRYQSTEIHHLENVPFPCGHQAAWKYDVRWQMSQDIHCDTNIVHLVLGNI